MWERTFDAIGEGILVYDEEQNIVRCNANAAEMIDHGHGLVAGRSFPEAFARIFGKPAAHHYLCFFAWFLHRRAELIGLLICPECP
jgi:PAS domain-containing protein